MKIVKIENSELMKMALSQVPKKNNVSMTSHTRLFSSGVDVYLEYLSEDFRLRKFKVGKTTNKDFSVIVQASNLHKIISDEKKAFNLNISDVFEKTDSDSNFVEFEMQDGMKVELATIEQEDWFDFRHEDVENVLTVTSESFFDIIDYAMIAGDKANNRYVYNGIKIDKECLVSTDGRRLHTINHNGTFNVSYADDDTQDVVVPLTVLKELKKYKKHINSDITFSIDKDNIIHIMTGSIHLTDKNLEGKYPDYNKVIPVIDFEENLIIQLDRKSFLKKLEKIKKFADLPTYASTLTIENNKAELKTSIPDRLGVSVALSKETVSIKNNNDYFHVGFNVTYMIDTVKHMKSDAVILSLIAGDKPMVIDEAENESKGIVKENRKAKAIIMPMKL